MENTQVKIISCKEIFAENKVVAELKIIMPACMVDASVDIFTDSLRTSANVRGAAQWDQTDLIMIVSYMMSELSKNVSMA